ncbi:MAG: tetratricopeptide repeat protein [Phycisphaerae bacterium]|jgi:tetratricopeptide (TPR) repeat protein
MDLGLPPFNPDAVSKPYRRRHCTDQYDARAMGHHALDAGMFDAFEADDMEGEGKAHYNAGVVAYERGDLDEAAACFIKAISKAPDAGPARNNLAIVLFQRGDRAEALSHLERLARDHPEQPNVLRNLAVAKWLGGDSEQALELLERAAELDPQDGELLFLQARIHGDLDRPDRMAECMQRAAELEPDNAAACDNLGVALQNAGMIDEAIHQFEEAHRLEPDNPLPLYNLGQALHEADRDEEAVEMLRRHLEMRPDHSCAHHALARALSELGRHDEALEEFRRYEELEPDDPAGLSSTGTELGLIGRHDEAEAAIRRAFVKDPAFHWAIHALALVARAKGDHARALALAAEAVRREPDQPVYQRVLIEAHVRTHDIQQSIDMVRSLPGRGEPSVWLRLLTTLRDEQRPADAVAAGQAAIADHPDHTPLLGTLALALDDLGRKDEALAMLRRTTAADPDDLLAHFHAGRILAEQGEFAKARAALEFVIEHDPKAIRPREFLLYCCGNLELEDECDRIAQEILELDPDNAYLKELSEAGEEESEETDGPDQSSPDVERPADDEPR